MEVANSLSRSNAGGIGQSSSSSSTFPPSSGGPAGGRRGIRWVEDVSQYYKLGGNVMPSCHSGMEIRHAYRTAMSPAEQESGVPEPLVVKVRYKAKSFQGRNDEPKWRHTTELILNIPYCPGIARIYEVIEDPRAYYVIMERAGGCDLYECLSGAPEKRLPPHEAKDVLRELLSAVAELHSFGFIHKDLKLENVMLNRAGAKSPAHMRRSLATTSGAGVKLIDFDTVEEWTADSPKAKHVLGTDQYIAPEAYDGGYSPLSDVFAVGVIAYKLLTGTFPYNGRLFNDKPGENWVGSPKMREIKEKLCEARVSWRHAIFDREPGAQALISRMLAVRERDRPQAQECLNDPWMMHGGKSHTLVSHGNSIQQQLYQDAAPVRPATIHHVRGKAMVQQHQQQHPGGGRSSMSVANQHLQQYLTSPAAPPTPPNQRRKRHPTGSVDNPGDAKDSWASVH